jgi:SAM-dependent methyltransferase
MQTVDRPNSALRQLQTVLGNTRQPRLTDERFDKAHELFERSSNQQMLILDWLKDFSVRHTSADPLSFLSVGCGSGILDNPLLEALSDLGSRIVYTAIDPNAVACSRFRGDFGLLEMPNVQLEVRQETVESISCDQKFDIIHAVHSLYYFDDPAATIKRLLVRMRIGGKLLILQAPKAELNRLADCFWFPNQDVDIWFSERLETYLQGVDLAYTKTRIHGRVDVARCFEAECADGEMMLDFITQVNCRELTQAAREQLLGCLTAIAERDGDRVWVKHPVDAFAIDAPPADGDWLA